MRREEIEKIVEEAGNKSRKNNGPSIEKIRQILNALFLLGAFVGVILYFTHDHIIGMIIVGVAMVLKAIEFFLRFLF